MLFDRGHNPAIIPKETFQAVQPEKQHRSAYNVLARTEVFVSFDKVVIMIFQLALLALGEEIAWRAFFQKQLSKALPIIPTLLISSVLFAIGHFNQGNAVIVLYDVFFVFINSVLYGIIFRKTNNAWISAISHFVANLFSIIVLVFL